MPVHDMHADSPSPLNIRSVVVCVIDMVDSVVQMAHHEQHTISIWRNLVQHCTEHILPSLQGRMVKSLGDGMMLEFNRAHQALEASRLVNRYLTQSNQLTPGSPHICVRAGLHHTLVYADELDIYGTGVNLAARLATLGKPNDIVASQDLIEQLLGSIDGHFDDLGFCYLKNMPDPVRAWRYAENTTFENTPTTKHEHHFMNAVVAVVPFAAKRTEPGLESFGEFIVDGLIAQLSKNQNLRVTSRLSTRHFQDRVLSPQTIASQLNADYVLSGNYWVQSDVVIISLELCASTNTNHIIFAQRYHTTVQSLMAEHGMPYAELSQLIYSQLMGSVSKQALTSPLPNIESFALLLGAIHLMHRSNASEFKRSKVLLEQLIERHPKLAIARAWLAKWYILKTTRFSADEQLVDANAALQQTRTGLDYDAQCALSLSMQGFVYCHLLKDLDCASLALNDALTYNPSEPLAHLFSGAVAMFKGKNDIAFTSTKQAIELSPLDPQRYYFLSLHAATALACGKEVLSVALAKQSLHINPHHSSTLRTLIAGLVGLDEMEQAQDYGQQLLRIDPAFSTRHYLERSPANAQSMVNTVAQRLKAAGLPD
jgi:adenylate cyclase